MSKCRLAQDDDGHWYAVPVEEYERFNRLIELGWDRWSPAESQFIEDCRIDHPYSLVFDWPQEKA